MADQSVKADGGTIWLTLVPSSLIKAVATIREYGVQGFSDRNGGLQGMKDKTLKVEYISIDELKPYERNAKLHPVKQIEQIAKSIKEYGMNDPIGVWKDNVIIEGHGRLEACKKLGIETVPIVRLDHLTDEQRREYTLVHNQTTMNSDFDTEMLDFEIKDLQDFDAGFYDFELASEKENAEIVEDEVPEEVETRCKLGDLWALGDHRLICGDSTDPEVIKSLTGGE